MLRVHSSSASHLELSGVSDFLIADSTLRKGESGMRRAGIESGMIAMIDDEGRHIHLSSQSRRRRQPWSRAGAWAV